MKKIVSFFSKYSLLVLFTALVGVFTVIDMVKQPREFSELENKKLPSMPQVTFKNVIENKFTLDYEKYINGQFLLRDEWLGLKGLADSVFAKISSSGVIAGKNDQLFAQNFNYDKTRFNGNLQELKKYMSKYADTKVMLVPSAYTIYPELLPTGASSYMVEQAQQLEQAKAELGADNIIDIRAALKASKDEYIYYRTDHHWTTDGAYIAYRELMNRLGMPPIELSDIEQYRAQVQDFRGTNHRKWILSGIDLDTITYYDLPVNSFKIDNKPEVETNMYGKQTLDNMYMEEAFKHTDKYEAFLYGNFGLTVIENEVNTSSPRSILVIKDSYANCFVPFLTRSFDKVVVVDPRSVTPANLQYLKRQRFDQRLVLFSLESFQAENNIFRINM